MNQASVAIQQPIPHTLPAKSAQTTRAKRSFVVFFVLLLMLKVLLALRLPLFVDEAFYWQEGAHLAWAYSDLPALTASLARAGVELFGTHTLGLRLLFLLQMALLPWLIVALTRREFGHLAGWQAGCWALCLPLLGSLGLLAIPDATLALATVLCMDSTLRLLRSQTDDTGHISTGAAAQLAFGLVLGGLTHYRFAAVIAVGFIALLLLPQGRALLRQGKVITAIAIGALAWLPLLWWNWQNADAGLRFQLLDRHDWGFSLDGFQFIVVQAVMVTPLLLLLFALAAWRNLRSDLPAQRYLAWLGTLTVLGFFVLGFFADRQRVSFHWPLPGYIALIPLLPQLLATLPRILRWTSAALALLGLTAMLGYYAFVATPQWRENSASSRWYPENFAGWQQLADAVQQEMTQLPAGTQLIADNFKVGAELGFALNNPNITVLPHPLNQHHGRAVQLHLWGLLQQSTAPLTAPALLVISDDDVKFSDLLAHYQTRCRQFAGLGQLRRTVMIDHGARRFLLFYKPLSEHASTASTADAPCITPAMAHIDTPQASQHLPRQFTVSGWAIKDDARVDTIQITINGQVIAETSDTHANHWLHDSFLKGASRDLRRPLNQFSVQVDGTALPAGKHWLGLRLHSSDGSVEDIRQIPIIMQ